MNPKAIAEDAKEESKELFNSFFDVRTRSAMNGAFFGAGLGFMYALITKQKIYLSVIIGSVAGGIISKALSTPSEEEEV